MTRTDGTRDTDRTEPLPTRTYVVPDVETTDDDIEATGAEDTFTPPTKVRRLGNRVT